MIHILFTGGTISMQRDAAVGGNVPAHGGEALVGLAPGLDRIAPYRIEDWARMPACHFDHDRLWTLRERVRVVAESGEAGGIVITHGTDILEETAYLLDRTLEPRVPVALTGAMRTSSDDGWDGPRNLRDAVAVAADPASAGRGTMVVFAGQVLAGRTATKSHATDVVAFSAPHAAPIGRVSDGGVSYAATGTAPAAPIRPESLRARVAHIPMVVGDDGALLDLARPAHDGVVVEAFGSGNVPPGAVAAIGRWLDEGKPVVLASRCWWGRVTPVYAFDGGGARTTAMGAIPAGPRTPSQARMELAIALSAGVPYGSA
ncbi:MAG: asparaginase [Gemmatimonadales bacterium]|nr:asparaginase [Gemmatimonadales bacterium]